MDLHFTCLVREKEARRILRRYHSVVMRIRRFYFLDGGLALALAVFSFFGNSWGTWCLCVLVVLFYSWGIEAISFSAWWRSQCRAMRHAGVFTMPEECHLTDEFLEIRRGETVTHMVLRENVTGFYYREDMVLLFCDTFFAGALRREKFPEQKDFDEFVAHLRRSGFADLTPFPFRRALVPWLLGMVVLAGWAWQLMAAGI